MTTGEVSQAARVQDRSGRKGPTGQTLEQAAENREIIRAIREINEGGGVGPSSEIRFSIDPETHRLLVKIVDRVTDEVIRQVPPETILRTAQVLKSLRDGDRLA